MAPINTLSVLAFATAALAVPYHGHGHAKYHNNKPSGFVYSYANANGTGIYPTGTGLATGAPIAPASETAVVSDVEFTTEVATTYADATTTCTSDITVTSTVKKTVTVTASASSEAASVESSSSSEASPVLSTSESSAPSSGESSAPAYSAAPTSYSSKAEAVTQAAYSSPAPSSSASAVEESSSSAASPTLTYSAANKNVDLNIGYGSSSSAAPSASASSYSGSTSSNSKRGVAYNDAKLADCLTSSPKISWGYNWGSSPAGLEHVKFIPTLWGTDGLYTDSWADNAQSAIDSGSTHLFSFNEPDHSAQSSMSPESAASAWKEYMEPFAGKAQLCSPSVTNGGGSMGLNWLKSFLESCSDCTIDCLNIHWYDSAENVEYFKKHISDAADLAPGKPIFVSEFAATGDQEKFLETVMPWMDSNDVVAGYSYFMASDGVLVSGNEPSTLGQVYVS
jgi:hypothetical protein